MMKTQIQHAYALALAHGHLWASCVASAVRDGSPFPETWEDVSELFRRLADEIGGEFGGVTPSPSHTTGSGRLRWDVREDGSVRLSVRTPGRGLLALRALETAAYDVRGMSLDDELLTATASAAYLAALRAGRDASEGVEVIGAEVAPLLGGGYHVVITPSQEDRGGGVTVDLGPATRHWLCLREALRALPAGVIEAVVWPADAAAAFAAWDESESPVRAAKAEREAIYAAPLAEHETPEWQRRYEAACEALRLAEAAAAPRSEEIYRSETARWLPAPRVEMARRRRGGVQMPTPTSILLVEEAEEAQ